MVELNAELYSKTLEEPQAVRDFSATKSRRKSYAEKMEQLRGKISVESVRTMKTWEFFELLGLGSSTSTSTALLKRHEEEIGKVIYFFQIKEFFHRRKQKVVLNDLSHIRDEESETKANVESIERYLKSLLMMPDIQTHDVLMQFLEISAITYDGAGRKYKEVYVKKRSGGRYKENSWFLSCFCVWMCWKKRYFLITSEGVMYSRSHEVSEANIRESLLFDHNFYIESGKKHTGEEKGLILNYSNRRLRIVALNVFSFYDILAALQEAFDSSPYVTVQRFGSFAPVRSHAECKWYIDGESYFSDVFECFNLAKEEIFIAGWWIAPYMYLKRPVSHDLNQHSRLDHVLKSAAERGVSIKIIVYCESNLALNINSGWTRQVLEALHPNIKVLRHPGNILPILWSHHEKMLVIDQQVGFLGGLDLCYGRMDSQDHPLFEPRGLAEGYEFFPGMHAKSCNISGSFKRKHFILLPIPDSRDERSV